MKIFNHVCAIDLPLFVAPAPPFTISPSYVCMCIGRRTQFAHDHHQHRHHEHEHDDNHDHNQRQLSAIAQFS